MKEVRWERMFPDQLEDAFAECPVVYFTYGLCEPHGPHNALGLDTLKAHGIAVHAARRYGGIVAPPHYWHVHEVAGYASWAHREVGEVRPWLTAVPPWVHFHEICYHVRTADALGFHAAIFLTGHYGPNWEDLKLLLEKMQPHTPTRLYGLPDFEANVRGFDLGGRSTGDHAGKVETSLLWSLEPGCVDMSRLPATDAMDKPHFAMGKTAHLADRRVGDRMVEDEAAWLGKKAEELLAEYKPPANHSPLTFEQVEAIWDEEILPLISSFKSMQPAKDDTDGPPKTSRWHANFHIPEKFRR